MWYKRNTNWIWITRRRKVRTVDFSFLVFLFLVCFIFINVMVYITLLRRCTLVSFYFFLLFFNHRFYLLSLNYYCNYTITLYKFLFFCNNFLYVLFFPVFCLELFPLLQRVRVLVHLQKIYIHFYFDCGAKMNLLQK